MYIWHNFIVCRIGTISELDYVSWCFKMIFYDSDIKTVGDLIGFLSSFDKDELIGRYAGTDERGIGMIDSVLLGRDEETNFDILLIF